MGTGSGASIRQRLSILVLITTSSALALVTLAFVVHDVVGFRNALERHVSILAEVAARNSVAPLLFDDPMTAEETLEALAADPHLVTACVYRTDGTALAHYIRGSALEREGCPPARPDGHGFSGASYILHRGIHHEGEALGSVFVESDTQALTSRLQQSAVILLGVLLGASAFSVALSTRLQRQISLPIQELAATSRTLAGGDLSVTVRDGQPGEIGLLAGAFSEMARGLTGLVARIREDMQSVAVVTEELRGDIERTSADAASQEKVVEEAVGSTQRLLLSIDGVARSVETISHEAGSTANAIAQMEDSTSHVARHMDDLGGSIDATISSVEQVIGSVKEVASSVAPLHEATTTAAVSLEELRQTVGSVAANAEETRQLTDRSAREAERGLRSVGEAIQGMLEIRESFRAIESAVTELSQESEAIGEIVEVINGVVSQTGLLALNAHIIAAQAGEHGKGFAVVADEVKELTERTSQSAQQISTLVQSVQARTQSVVGAVEEGARRAEVGDRRSQEAGETLSSISNGVQESAARAGEIATATQQQATAIRSVDDVVSGIRDMVERIHEATREQTRASEEISGEMETVRALGRDVTRLAQAQAQDSRVIATAFGEVTAMIRDTHAASRDQSEESQRISAALETFRQAAAASTERAVTLGRTVQTLASHSEALEQEIRRFKLETQASKPPRRSARGLHR